GDTKMDTNGVTIKDGANEAIKLTKDGLQINDGGNKAVTIDKDGLTIENGPKVTKDGINAGDKKITNVVIVPLDPSSLTCLVGSVPSVIVSFKDILIAVPSTEVLMLPSPFRSIT
ncbi:Hemagluttinin protein, partial [human gut metagenome]